VPLATCGISTILGIGIEGRPLSTCVSARMNVSLCSDTVCNVQEPGQHSSPAECAFDAHAVSTDMEDLAPATPTKPVAAGLLGSPLTPVGCTPVDTAQPTAPLAAVHVEQARANFEQPAQPKQPVCAHAAEDVEAGLSTATVDSPSTSSSAGCASAAQSVEDVVEMLLAAGRAMHQAQTDSSALEHPDSLTFLTVFFCCCGKLLFIPKKWNKRVTQRNLLLYKSTYAKLMCNLSLHTASHSQTYDACFVAVCILVVFGTSQCEHEVQ